MRKLSIQGFRLFHISIGLVFTFEYYDIENDIFDLVNYIEIVMSCIDHNLVSFLKNCKTLTITRINSEYFLLLKHSCRAVPRIFSGMVEMA